MRDVKRACRRLARAIEAEAQDSDAVMIWFLLGLGLIGCAVLGGEAVGWWRFSL